MEFERLKIGVSSCLLGKEVRFNGGHKKDAFLVDVMSRFANWVPVCPEVEAGMGIPRESVRLVEDGKELTRMVTVKSGRDFTQAMDEAVAKRIPKLSKINLDGYVLKSKSPSCGLFRVKVYNEKGGVARLGSGKFAEALVKAFPHLPVEEEGRLNDPRLRENFISRCYAYHRWRNMIDAGLSRKALVKFHEQHKFLLLAHNQAGYRRMGGIVARPQDYDSDMAMAEAYLVEFTSVVSRPSKPGNHTNSLQHMFGFFSKKLEPADRNEVSELIEGYRLGLVPLIVPITMIRHYARKMDVTYLLDQVYLNPHPGEMMLLNRV